MDPKSLRNAVALFDAWQRLDRLQASWMFAPPGSVTVKIAPRSEFEADEAVVMSGADAIRFVRSRMDRISDQMVALGCLRPWPTEHQLPEGAERGA